MSSFDYAAIFYGIVVALAVETVAMSLHKLLAAGKRVTWHWMSPAIAFNASMVTLGEFWLLWIRRNEATGVYTLFQFLPFAASLIIMFLSAAATLPDEVPEAGIDLREFYFDHRKHYWGLVVAFFAFNIFLDLLDVVRFGWSSPPWRRDIPLVVNDLLAIAIATPLIFLRWYWLHAVGITFGAVYLLYFLGSLQVG